jgi:hypothetical protein
MVSWFQKDPQALPKPAVPVADDLDIDRDASRVPAEPDAAVQVGSGSGSVWEAPGITREATCELWTGRWAGVVEAGSLVVVCCCSRAGDARAPVRPPHTHAAGSSTSDESC